MSDHLVTELAFWLFLIHQGRVPREWFSSWEFRAWYLGQHMWDLFRGDFLIGP
jgi:hypothetical protein